MIVQPSVQIGFADSGAHLRNMGFYNFALQLLRMVQQAEAEGQPRVCAEGNPLGIDPGLLQGTVNAEGDEGRAQARNRPDGRNSYPPPEMEFWGVRP